MWMFLRDIVIQDLYSFPIFIQPEYRNAKEIKQVSVKNAFKPTLKLPRHPLALNSQSVWLNNSSQDVKFQSRYPTHKGIFTKRIKFLGNIWLTIKVIARFVTLIRKSPFLEIIDIRDAQFESGQVRLLNHFLKYSDLKRIVSPEDKTYFDMQEINTFLRLNGKLNVFYVLRSIRMIRRANIVSQ
jgi:hypothetical protein